MSTSRAPTLVPRMKRLLFLYAQTSQPIFDDDKFVTDFMVYNPVGNGDICVGDYLVDINGHPISAGESVNFIAGDGNLLGYSPTVPFNLANIYVVASVAGNEVLVQYLEVTTS